MRFQLKIGIRCIENNEQRRAAWKKRVSDEAAETCQGVSYFLLRWDLDVAIFVFEVPANFTEGVVKEKIDRALQFAGHASVMASAVGFDIVLPDRSGMQDVCEKAVPAGKALAVDYSGFTARAQATIMGYLSRTPGQLVS